MSGCVQKDCIQRTTHVESLCRPLEDVIAIEALSHFGRLALEKESERSLEGLFQGRSAHITWIDA
eukprot:6486148-Amphidinium_carterae.1